jgi:hypothetical protein
LARRPFSFPPLAYCLYNQTDFRRDACFHLPKSPLELTDDDSRFAGRLSLVMRHYAYPKRRYTYAPACLGPGGMFVIMLANKFLPVVEHHEEAHEDKPAEASAGA